MKTGLFGIINSNRDFTNKSSWGKNQFNSSFPTSLCLYMDSVGVLPVYLKLNSKNQVIHDKISAKELYGGDVNTKNIYYSFESIFSDYEVIVEGELPRVDLVTKKSFEGSDMSQLEIKLTALPDNTTCNLSQDKFGSEIVVRPDSIVYLACSIILPFLKNPSILKKYFKGSFLKIQDWSKDTEVINYIDEFIYILDDIFLKNLHYQKPVLMQPVWKTEGKSPKLSKSCLDMFIWSNYVLSQLFLDRARNTTSYTSISRPVRTIIWLFKMIYDFSFKGKFDHEKIIDRLSYNTKNDKAFALSGSITHKYMKCKELTSPRISKEEIKNVILNGGESLLSPERRLDSIISNSDGLF